MPDATRTDALMALADSYAIAMAGYVAGNHSHLADQSAIKDESRAALASAIAELEQECAALRKDAGRYQELRDIACEGYPSCEGSQNKDAYLVITGYDYPMTKEQKDAAIDAALAAQPEKV